MATLDAIVDALRGYDGLRFKRDLAATVAAAHTSADARVPLGDDCAAIPDGDGHLLFAIEGLLPGFVERDPWFAGYSGVMVNLSDIAAMGGRPVAVTDAVWARNEDCFAGIWEGMRAAAAAYDVPIVGGHTHARSDRDLLAVAVVGRARTLLTSFAARPDHRLLYAVDLRGEFRGDDPFWNASSHRDDHDRLRGDLALLPVLAEAGRVDAAKDVSMAGLLGTALMLLECSSVGCEIDLDAIPRPAGVDLYRWLISFPSYGYLLAVEPPAIESVERQFFDRGLACAEIGSFNATRRLEVRSGGEAGTFWDLNDEPLMALGPAQTV